MQMQIPFLFALDANAVPMPIDDAFFGTEGRHGGYPWAASLFNTNGHLPFQDTAAVMAAFPDLRVIQPAAEGDYNARVKSVEGQCNVIIEVDMQVCGGLCYYASGQPRFQRLRHVLACNMMQNKGRATLPPLLFDRASPDEYVVALHVRRGDANLHADEEMGARAYFAKIKEQVDEVLQVGGGGRWRSRVRASSCAHDRCESTLFFRD